MKANALSLVLFACCLALSWGQVEPSDTSISPQVEPGALLPPPEQSWAELDSLLTELEQTAMSLSSDSERLRDSLNQALVALGLLSTKLETSETTAKGLSSSLALSEASLTTCAESLREAQQQARAREAELWIWRGGTAVGIVLAFAGFVWGATR